MREGRYSLQRATLQDLIRIARGAEADKVVGGPAWLSVDRFDLVARAPAGATPAMVPAMLQRLLIERSRLKVHDDSRLLPAFVLRRTNAKPKLKEGDDAVRTADASNRTGCQEAGAVARDPDLTPARSRPIECRNVSMEEFVRELQTLDRVCELFAARFG